MATVHYYSYYYYYYYYYHYYYYYYYYHYYYYHYYYYYYYYCLVQAPARHPGSAAWRPAPRPSCGRCLRGASDTRCNRRRAGMPMNS